MNKSRNTKTKIPGKQSGDAERRHLKSRASDQHETRNHLQKTVILQADALTNKDGQIKTWKNKERMAEEQIHIRTKVMDSASDGIFIIDVQMGDFSIIYSNQAFQAMTGYAKQDILGKNYFLFCEAIVGQCVAEEIKNTLRQGKHFHGEILAHRKSGQEFWSYLRIFSVHDASGVVTHYAGIQTDVTVIRQRDLKIKEQREELLHVTRVGKLAEFVSSLAHEISQPLTAILAYAQAAQRMLAGKEPELQEILQYIVDDDQRASEVIRRLRSLLKKSEPEFTAIDINALIKETVVLMMTDVIVRNKVISTDLHLELPPIHGDRIQLQQVLLNLISNSLDAMEANAESRELLIRTSRYATKLIMIEVKDSGCGIPEENWGKLFRHFFTSKADGLGMGLSISRSIVEAHGGRLEAKNNPDGGATFYFTVPVMQKAKQGAS